VWVCTSIRLHILVVFVVFVQEREGSLLSWTDDDSCDVAIHGPSVSWSVAVSVEQRQTSTVPSCESSAKKLLEFRPFHSKKSPGATTVAGLPKTDKGKVLQLPMKTPTSQTVMQVEKTVDKTAAAEVPSKKTMRPASWLLHSVGLRMVREKVYDDLIEIQEQKGAESQLSTNERKQLERLQAAHAELVRQNRAHAVRARRRCRCGFAVASRLELELHRDYGTSSALSVTSDAGSLYFCCLCGTRNVRTPSIMYTHIERCHGRQPRMQAVPPTSYCPFCPYELRTKGTKAKLSRHVLNCALTFRIDRNLAPTASDADIPLFETAYPPASSVQTSTTASSVAGLSSSTVLSHKVSDVCT